MKKSTRIRPVLESLESMMLLSTAVAEVHAPAKPVAHVQEVTAEATTVALHGTLHGTGKISGTSAAVSGSGNLGKVGNATFKLSANLTNPPSTVTLSTKKGNLFLQASSSLVGSGSSGSTTYSIVGGTKSYAGATGSGMAAGSYSISGGKLSLTIHFS